MATRTADLYPPATVIADHLARRLGNQKLVLSAGVMVLAKLNADDREAACQEALGEPQQELDLYAERKALEKIRDQLAAMQLEDARHGGGQLRLEDVLKYVMPIISRGMEARTRPVPLGGQHSKDALAQIKDIAVGMQETQYRLLSPEEQHLVDEIRRQLGPSDEELARQTADAAQSHEKVPERTKAGKVARGG